MTQYTHESDNSKPSYSQKVMERFRFIEHQLYWEGRINRTALTAKFGTSKPQATLDIKAYQELAPKNLTYDLREKHYLPSYCFDPIFDTPSATDYLNNLCFDENDDDLSKPKCHTLPSFKRPVDPEILREILSAMRNDASIKIKYQSPYSPDQTNRWITPLVFVYALGHWHVRAFCHLKNEFRSFVLGRIITTGETRKETDETPEDTEWSNLIDLVFTPSNELHENAKKIITNDYGMTNGKAVIPVKRALLKYFLLENKLLEGNAVEPGVEPELLKDNGLISLDNFEEVHGALCKEYSH